MNQNEVVDDTTLDLGEPLFDDDVGPMALRRKLGNILHKKGWDFGLAESAAELLSIIIENFDPSDIDEEDILEDDFLFAYSAISTMARYFALNAQGPEHVLDGARRGYLQGVDSLFSKGR